MTNQTSEKRVARAFGLTGDNWMRHANAVSVWTRFAVLPLIGVAVWSRDWIGWWSLVPIALSLIFMMINPLLFSPPKSTRNWASKAVFGERVWADRNDIDLPAKYRASRAPAVQYTAQTVGLIVMIYGLVQLDVVAAVSGLLVIQIAKIWFLDRMVLMFEEMKTGNPEYASWEY
ncbi:DUF6653 family protein [Actinoplanes sp. NPDC051470]|uniref:DUF6653 family protein n=1 Tax=unclassified Actinoplanes TaxID=2626549 RepID=UPI003436029A